MENKTANAGPLGMIGFGMTTVLLNLHNSGVIELSIVIASMGFALGGLAQIIAGIMEFRAGNTFGATAFTAYGTFWWSLVIIWANPGGFFTGAESMSVGFYLLIWGIFTALMFVGTLKHDHATQTVFITLAILFILLAIGEFTGNGNVTIAAGIVGLVCGLVAIYTSTANVINGEFGRTVLPIGAKK